MNYSGYKHMRDCLESFHLIAFYIPHLHNLLKTETIPSLVHYNPTDRKQLRITAKDTYGALDHLRLKANPRRTLIDMVARTEHYLGLICAMVYHEFPERFLTFGEESIDRVNKLTKIILESENRKEIIDILIEEKIRSIFYGNPADFFLKKKIKLQIDQIFNSTFKSEIEKYSEIIARRNIYAHNDGRVDRKYLKGVKGSTFKLNTILPIEDRYLIDTFHILVGLAATTSYLIINNFYSKEIGGQIEYIYNEFSSESKISA